MVLVAVIFFFFVLGPSVEMLMGVATSVETLVGTGVGL